MKNHLSDFISRKFETSQKKEERFSYTSELADVLNHKTCPHEISTQILSYMHSIDKEKNYYGEGFNGRVYVVPVIIGVEKKKLLVIKARKDKTDQNKLITEYQNHLNMFMFSNKQQSEYIGVPKLYGLQNDEDGDIYLIMDFIEGMTLYTYKISQVLPILYDELLKLDPTSQTILGNRSQYTTCANDKDAKKLIEKILSEFKKYPESEIYEKYLYDFYGHKIHGTYMEQKQAHIYDRMVVDFGLETLSPKTVDNLQKASIEYIDAMHREGLYHNDITHRNVIMGADGKIYLIDFDKSGTENDLSRKNMKDVRYIEKIHGKSIQGDYKLISYLEYLKMK